VSHQEASEPDHDAPADRGDHQSFDTSVAHVARVYDY
jgi:hypothetical protein